MYFVVIEASMIPAHAWIRASIEVYHSGGDLNRGRKRGSNGLRTRDFAPRSRFITAEVTSIEVGIVGEPACARVVSCLDRGSSQRK